MTRAEFVAEFASLIEAPAGTSEATDLASLAGWDSMGRLSFMAFADEQLGCEVSPAQLAECATVGDLASLLGDRLAA